MIRKRLLAGVCAVVLMLAALPAHATLPVVDYSNLVQAIENGIQQAQEVANQATQIQNQIKQLQNEAAMIEALP